MIKQISYERRGYESVEKEFRVQRVKQRRRGLVYKTALTPPVFCSRDMRTQNTHTDKQRTLVIVSPIEAVC